MGIWNFSSHRSAMSAGKSNASDVYDVPRALEGALNTSVNLLLVQARTRVALIVLLFSTSFLVANQLLLNPMNFGTFSQVMPLFISGLSALLGLVVGFATFSMRNETRSMASHLKQLDGIEELLGPLQSLSKADASKVFSNAARYATEATYRLVEYTSNMTRRILSSGIAEQDHHLGSICKEYLQESDYCLSLFFKTRSIYSLAMMSPMDFIIRVRFKPETAADANNAVSDFYEAMRRLHVIRNIASTVYMRHNISNLTYEMLFTTIPIIVLTGAVSFAFSYDVANATLARLAYAGAFSMTMIPFIIFAMRTILLVNMTKRNAALPFSRE